MANIKIFTIVALATALAGAACAYAGGGGHGSGGANYGGASGGSHYGGGGMSLYRGRRRTLRQRKAHARHTPVRGRTALYRPPDAVAPCGPPILWSPASPGGPLQSGGQQTSRRPLPPKSRYGNARFGSIREFAAQRGEERLDAQILRGSAAQHGELGRPECARPNRHPRGHRRMARCSGRARMVAPPQRRLRLDRLRFGRSPTWTSLLTIRSGATATMIRSGTLAMATSTPGIFTPYGDDDLTGDRPRKAGSGGSWVDARPHGAVTAQPHAGVAAQAPAAVTAQPRAVIAAQPHTAVNAMTRSARAAMPDPLAQMCDEDSRDIAGFPIDRIQAAIAPNDVQRAALDDCQRPRRKPLTPSVPRARPKSRRPHPAVSH